jgi:hypothetical protein
MKKGAWGEFGRNRGALPRLRGRGEQGMSWGRFRHDLSFVTLRRRPSGLLVRALEELEFMAVSGPVGPIEIDRARITGGRALRPRLAYHGLASEAALHGSDRNGFAPRPHSTVLSHAA